MNGLSSPPVSSTANTGFVTESNSSREPPGSAKDFVFLNMEKRSLMIWRVQSGGFCEVAGLSRAAGRRGERDLIEAELNEAAAVLKILAAGVFDGHQCRSHMQLKRYGTSLAIRGK